MDTNKSLSHSKWECRRRALNKHLLTAQEECQIKEVNLMHDHVQMLISITPKHAVSQVVGFIKGKSAINLARVYGERKRNFVGQHFCGRGYFVSTVRCHQATIRENIRDREKLDERLEHLKLWK